MRSVGPVTDSYEVDNEYLGFIKSDEFLGKLRDRLSTRQLMTSLPA
jgi:hypothetical protein